LDDGVHQRRCWELTGYSSYDLTLNRTRSFNDLIVPGDREQVWENVQESLRAKTPYQVQYRITTADGKIKWSGRKGKESAGVRRARSPGGFITDITERKSAEERVREQAALLDRAQDAIYVEDLDGVIGFWNRGAGSIYGCPRGTCGRKADSLLRKEGPAHAEIRSSVLEKGEWVGERTECAKDGRAITVECRCSIVRNDSGSPSPSLSSIPTSLRGRTSNGSFSGPAAGEYRHAGPGIAHDLNNVLAPITMSIAMLRDKLADPRGSNGSTRSTPQRSVRRDRETGPRLRQGGRRERWRSSRDT